MKEKRLNHRVDLFIKFQRDIKLNPKERSQVPQIREDLRLRVSKLQLQLQQLQLQQTKLPWPYFRLDLKNLLTSIA